MPVSPTISSPVSTSAQNQRNWNWMVDATSGHNFTNQLNGINNSVGSPSNASVDFGDLWAPKGPILVDAETSEKNPYDYLLTHPDLHDKVSGFGQSVLSRHDQDAPTFSASTLLANAYRAASSPNLNYFA